jgi:hypothetical protein
MGLIDFFLEKFRSCFYSFSLSQAANFKEKNQISADNGHLLTLWNDSGSQRRLDGVHSWVNFW